MHIDLTGRVAVVTGAGRGIGRVIADTLVGEGVTTVALDLAAPGTRPRSDAPGAPIPSRSTGAPVASAPGVPAPSGTSGAPVPSGTTGTLDPVACDVTDAEQVQAAMDGVLERHGRLDILVNNAGVNIEAPIDAMDPGDWSRVFDVNVGGVYLTCRAAMPAMKRQRFGRIVNAASFAAIIPSAGAAAYAASKAAVAMFTRTLAGELGPWGVTANAYAPGMIPTAMNRFADLPDAERERRLDMLTLRRWGVAEDVANLICFLASEQAGYITGTLIDVSGGKFATQVPSVPYGWDA